MSLAINDLQGRVGQHHKLLVTGNGELSYSERLRNAEKFIDEIKYWTRFVFGALILQTITFAAAVVIAVFRFLPILEKLAGK
jgi:hypothetical protein